MYLSTSSLLSFTCSIFSSEMIDVSPQPLNSKALAGTTFSTPSTCFNVGVVVGCSPSIHTYWAAETGVNNNTQQSRTAFGIVFIRRAPCKGGIVCG